MSGVAGHARQAAGALAYRSGLAAEDCVRAFYARAGYELAAQRWRARGAGEIDLVLRKGGTVVFVEIKRARDFGSAAARLGPAQIGRIFRAAEAFLAGEPNGADTDARFDVALVDGAGRIEIVENVHAA